VNPGTENREGSEVFSFEGFRLDASRRVLTDDSGEILPVMPKAFEILLYLVRRAGEVVEKDELLSAVWPDTVVEENNLTQNISALRRLLGEKHRENRFIATVPGRGYQFVAPVRHGEDAVPDTAGERPVIPIDAGDSPPVEPAQSRAALIGLGVLVLLTAAAAFFLLKGEGGGSVGDVRSIAVLPFKPLAASERDEAFELGMTESLIMKIGGEESLVVRPLSAVRRYGSLEQDARDAGRALGVDAVLDGNIHASEGRVRVSAMLIRVADGKQLWANQFHEDLIDVFDIQDSISERVAGALKMKLGNRDRRYTESIEAFQLYSRGKLHASRLIRPEVEKAIGLFEHAIAADPNYALAYVGVESANRALVLTSDAPPQIHMEQAKTAAQRAVEIDPLLADAWMSLGTVAFWYDWDWRTAESHYRRALDLDPNNAAVRMFYAHLLSNIGRHQEALDQLARAKQLDPANPMIGAVEGQALYFAGRLDDSAGALSAVIEMEPNLWLAHLFLARTYAAKGMLAEGTASAIRAREISRGSSMATATLGMLKAMAGERQQALALSGELEQRAAAGYTPHYPRAIILASLGEREGALRHLEAAAEERDPMMVFVRVEKFWEDLRGEERFARILDRMNF
jgi:DNA-binding winged helix-turn-helix (wHTH) protein/TolB-like protein/Tfp pilus assembly protein PilF